jgi:hypothetical protein
MFGDDCDRHHICLWWARPCQTKQRSQTITISRADRGQGVEPMICAARRMCCDGDRERRKNATGSELARRAMQRRGHPTTLAGGPCSWWGTTYANGSTTEDFRVGGRMDDNPRSRRQLTAITARGFTTEKQRTPG